MSRSDFVSVFVEAALTFDRNDPQYEGLSEEDLDAAQLRHDLLANKVEVALQFTRQLDTLTNVTDNANPEENPAYLASIKIISEVGENDESARHALDVLEALNQAAKPIEVINHLEHILPDTQKPTITLRGNSSIDLVVGSSYTDEGAEAYDELEGVLNIEIEGSVDPSRVGIYEIVYTATDCFGNQTSVIRRVVVKEPEKIWNVNNLQALREALEEASYNGMNDRVILAKGVYDTSADGEGSIVFSDTEKYSLTIEGCSDCNASDIILDANYTGRVLELKNSNKKSKIVLRNLTIKSGIKEEGYETFRAGGGLYVNTSLLMEHVYIHDCTGALQVDNRTWSVQNDFNVTIIDSNISSNVSKNSEGVVQIGIISHLVFEHSIFENNQILKDAALFAINAYNEVSFKRSKFLNNAAPYLFFNGLYYNINFDSCTIASNEIEYGSLVRANGIVIKDCNITDNKSDILISTDGGDRWHPYYTWIERSRFVNNISDDHNMREAMIDVHNGTVVNSVFVKNQTYSNNATIVNIHNGYVLNSTFYDNRDFSSYTNATLTLNGVICNSVLKDGEDTHSIRFAGDSWIYNTYVDYATIDEMDYSVIKKHNIRASREDVEIDENGMPESGTVLVNSGLKTDSLEFASLIDESPFEAEIVQALQYDVDKNTRGSLMDIGAYGLR